MKLTNTGFAAVGIFFGLNMQAYSSITITTDFDGIANGGGFTFGGNSALSAANQAIINDAAAFWTTQLTGYADGVSREVIIEASAFSVGRDNNGFLPLGSAGPRTLRGFSFEGTDFRVTATGRSQFNVSEDALGSDGLISAVTARHELGHVLGFGTLFTQNNLSFADGQYTGANGVAAFNSEFGQNSSFVPIEEEGGAGTADRHLNEGNTPGLFVQSGPHAGENIDDALLTGNLGQNSSGFLSDTSLGIFQDLGFTTVAFNAVPEPASTLFLSLGSLAIMIRRRR